MAQTKIKAGLFEGIIGNGTDGYFLMSNGDGTMTWSSVIINPTVSSIAYPGSVTAADPAGGETITVTGTGFKTGATVTVGGTTAPAVSYVSATQITFTTPAKAAGDYDIVVTNTDTGSATFINGISYNGIPSWTTAAGTLGTFASDTTISTITLQATEPDAGTITFSITNGALPTGLSLTGADIDGTTTLETADTLYTFTVTATDDESQATPRTFTITVTKQFINTDNFTINTYTGNGSTQSIEGKIGTAADFNGSSSEIVVPTVSNIKSYSFWIKAVAVGSNYGKRIFGLDSSSYTDCVTYIGNTSSKVGVVDGAGNIFYSDTVSDNNWHHIAITTDGNTLKIYTDGVVSSTNSTTYFTSSFTHIGSNNTNRQFEGNLDQVRIFDKELSSSEVTTLYGESNTSTTKSTTDIFDDGSGLALYEFEEGAKDTGGVNGYIGAGGVFNGSSSYIELDGTLANGNTGDFSISMWVNIPNSSSQYRLFATDTSPYYSKLNINIETNGKLRAAFGNGTSAETVVYTTSTNWGNGSWHHLVYTMDWNGSYFDIKFYQNGSLDSSHTTSGTSVAVLSNSKLILGGVYRQDNTTYYLDYLGKQDQVRIFDKALSSSEITTLYGETSASSTKSTTDIFNDSSGVALYELEGNANDTGKGAIDSGQSAVFNGSSSGITVNSFASLSQLGLSMWVNIADVTSNYSLAARYDTNREFAIYNYQASNGFVASIYYNGNNGNAIIFTAGDYLTNNTWHHIAFTSDGSTAPKLYIDGVERGTAQYSDATRCAYYTSTEPLEIGKSIGRFLNGKIDQVRIYSSALSSGDVTNLYNESSVPTANLVAHYKLDGNANDSAGSYNGTATSITYSDPAEFPKYDGTATNVTYAYDGTPTNVSFLGTSFQPDFVWIKNRSTVVDHALIDSVRGATEVLRSNQTTAETTRSDSLTSFDSNGFTLGSDGVWWTNKSGDNYVAWCWKAASSDSTNTDGTITSTVRANQDAGFSIVKYTAPAGSLTKFTVGHGLSSAPELVITRRIAGTTQWYTYSSATGAEKTLYLSLPNAASNTVTDFWGTDGMSNTTIGLTTDQACYPTEEHIAYCFTSITGYQKIGSYTGNGSAGNTVTGLGFQPRFLMIKNSTGTYEWVVVDSIRGGSNELNPNSSAAENGTGDPANITFNSDGFTINNAEGATNQNNATIIYLAIA